MTATITDDLKKIGDLIKRQRDEVKLQLHLAGNDLKDEWHELERDWDDIKLKLKAIKEDAEVTGDDAKQSLKDMMAKVEAGYQRMKSKL